MKRATRRERFENIVCAFVIVTDGRLPEDLGELLRAMRERVPGVTAEELRTAVRWSLRQGQRRGRALERAARREMRLETDPNRKKGTLADKFAARRRDLDRCAFTARPCGSWSSS